MSEISAFRPSLGPEELDAVRRVLESGWLGQGPRTREFEERLQAQLGARHVVCTCKGTAALHLALEALQLQPHDEVVVPSLTFPASVQAILSSGATPVFCEVSPATLNLDTDDMLRCFGERTRAVMPVHFAGLVCDMDRILAEARERGIAVVEDAAHAFGSSYRGRKVGTLGDLTCFSFDAIKNITCGEGGAVATERDDFARALRRGRSLGMDQESWERRSAARPAAYRITARGFRYHMSDLCAAIGLAQLDKQESFRRRKSEIVGRYDRAFRDEPGIRLVRCDLVETFPFAYVVRVPGGRRDALMRSLKDAGIGSVVQFTPNHLQPAFAEYHRSLPVTEALYGEILSLPLSATLTDGQVDAVIGAVLAFLGKGSQHTADAPDPPALELGAP